MTACVARNGFNVAVMLALNAMVIHVRRRDIRVVVRRDAVVVFRMIVIAIVVYVQGRCRGR